jgi:hypothetical protein
MMQGSPRWHELAKVPDSMACLEPHTHRICSEHHLVWSVYLTRKAAACSTNSQKFAGNDVPSEFVHLHLRRNSKSHARGGWTCCKEPLWPPYVCSYLCRVRWQLQVLCNFQRSIIFTMSLQVVYALQITHCVHNFQNRKLNMVSFSK